MKTARVSSEKPALDSSANRAGGARRRPARKNSMPIHIGIMCERCRRVHFVATSSAVQFSRSGGGVYRLKCVPPCGETKEFRKEGMQPYRVTDDVFNRGHALEGDYESIPA